MDRILTLVCVVYSCVKHKRSFKNLRPKTLIWWNGLRNPNTAMSIQLI